MIRRIITLSFVVLITFGCATTHDIIRAKQTGSEGISAIYEISKVQAWNITKTIFKWEGCEVVEEHPEKNYILATSKMGGTSLGAVIGVWIEPISSESMRVTVVSKRKMITNIYAVFLTERKFHTRFEQAVDMTSDGQQLPQLPPPRY